ncbi:MAG: hypothetical protein ACPGLY_02715 [Rubripirellula sp.]
MRSEKGDGEFFPNETFEPTAEWIKVAGLYLGRQVLSVASLAIILSSQPRVRLAEAQRFSTRGQAVADELYQRALATLRSDPNANETIQDPGNGISGARAKLERLSNNATRIELFLYPNSSIPVISTVIDPGAITEGKGRGQG